MKKHLKRSWIKFSKIQPEVGQPVEYVIEVVCKGYYNFENGLHNFVPKQGVVPDAKIVSWREASPEER